MTARIASGLCLLLVSWLASPALAAEKMQEDRPRVKLPAYWAGMANKVDLDYDQRVDLKAALDARKAALAELEPKLDKALADRRAARAAGNEADADEANERLRALREQEDKIEGDFLIVVRDLLEEDQVVDWEYGRLLFAMNMTFKKYGLTDSQHRTMEQLTREAAEILADLDPDDVDGSDEAIKQTKDRFYLDHLTEAQQQIRVRDVE